MCAWRIHKAEWDTLQQSLMNVLREHQLRLSVSSIVTQVEVDANDPGFANPTKPVGRFVGKEEAERISGETGWQFVEDAGRGYRRESISSPEPLRILDIPAIEAFLAADVIPIAAGGGGIPWSCAITRETFTALPR